MVIKPADARECADKGWVALHWLSSHLSLAVEECGNRHTVREKLEAAVWAHLGFYQLLQFGNKQKESATPRIISDLLALEKAFADVSLLFFAVLSSLGGQQHNLGRRQYSVDSRTEEEIETYQVVCFRRSNGQVNDAFATHHTQQAVRLAAAWSTFFVNSEWDVKLLAVLKSGAVVNCKGKTS